jgi:hypothetical protein
VTVSTGSSATSTITITPENGYTGTIGWAGSSSSTLSDACYELSDAIVSSTSAVTTSMTIYTSSSACSSASAVGGSGRRHKIAGAPTALKNSAGSQTQLAGIAMAGVLFAGLFVYPFARRGLLESTLLLIAIGLTVSGCGGSGSSSSSSSSEASAGTYTLTITGTDTSSSTITASTSMTLTID